MVLMILGVAAFIASIANAKRDINQRLSEMHRFVMPGQTTVSLNQPGTYLVYYEKVGEHAGETFDTQQHFPELPKLDFDVRHDPSARYLTVKRAVDQVSQIYRGGQANSEFFFEVPAELTPGEFTLSAAHENADLDARLLLSVGPPIVGEMMSDWRGPFGGAALLAFTFVISAVTVLLTWTLRHDQITRRD